MILMRQLTFLMILKRPLKISMVLKRPLNFFNGFGGEYHHWMFFGTLTIANNGFSMVFGSPNYWFQWFSMVMDHWSNDGMVSMDRTGLGQVMSWSQISKPCSLLNEHCVDFVAIPGNNLEPLSPLLAQLGPALKEGPLHKHPHQPHWARVDEGDAKRVRQKPCQAVQGVPRRGVI